jgi:AraC family transcriptional regulator
MDERLTAISRALEYIERHLKEMARVEDMAQACGYSLYYFIRLFNQCVHLTPYDYLIRRRLAQAALELLNGERRLLEIALDYGFQSAETFTRAFTRVFGIQPSLARKQGGVDERLLLRPCSREQLLYYQTCGVPRSQFSNRSMQLLGGYVFQNDLTPDRLVEIIERLQALQPLAREFFWVTTYPQPSMGLPPSYFAGIPVPDVSALPAQCLAKPIPAGSYACFSQSDLPAYLQTARRYIYQVWAANMAETFQSPLEACRISLQLEKQSSQILLPLFNNPKTTF